MLPNIPVKNPDDILKFTLDHVEPTRSDMQALLAAGHCTAKYSDCGRFILYKYRKNIMFNGSWFDLPHAVMQCRGHVYSTASDDERRVVHAPVKSFNYKEFGWWEDVPLDTEVLVSKKYNGFLADRTFLSDDEELITTTGSFDSKYVQMSKELIAKKFKPVGFHELHVGVTRSYEILHEDDPHIVEDRNNFAGYLVDNAVLLQQREDVFRDPKHYFNECSYRTLADALEMARTDKGEGFMLRMPHDEFGMAICKLKTPYYTIKKKLMRATEKNLDKRIKECYDLHFANDTCLGTALVRVAQEKSAFLTMLEQERRRFIEECED
jgi:hypothetical protein